ncbi:hypothetical protein UPYG_G00337010 [Umbra pygmaea]|uniref:Uncharacterized protein n=1 Tax=Umbra pygmaea TaxID=75934 RepID=A0ABD0W0F9_UMBPY
MAGSTICSKKSHQTSNNPEDLNGWKQPRMKPPDGSHGSSTCEREGPGVTFKRKRKKKHHRLQFGIWISLQIKRWTFNFFPAELS